MYMAEINKKSFRLLLKCIGVYIVLALTIKFPITIAMGIISLIYFIYKRSLIKNNEIIDCDKYPHYIEVSNFHCFLGVLWGVSIIFFHFYLEFTYTG